MLTLCSLLFRVLHALQQAQQQLRVAQANIRRLKQTIQQKARNRRKIELTVSELKTMPDETRVFRAVGTSPPSRCP